MRPVAAIADSGTVPPMTLPSRPDDRDLSGDPVVTAVPVGTHVSTATGKFGLATATFDEHGIYRFRLSRVWGAPGAPRANFLMLNPSTADAFSVDPTIRRCLSFAQAWGAGALEVTNVFALRSTDPGGLRAVSDPVGPGNDTAILAAAQAADIVVAAWGVHARLGGREKAVLDLLAAAGVKLNYLRLTKAGHPGHPLYVPSATELTPWR